MKKRNQLVIILFLIVGIMFSCKGKSNKSLYANKTENKVEKQLTKAAQSHRYPFEYGIIYQKMDVMGIVSSPIIYFDKWGEWETTETTTSMEIMGTKQSSTSLKIAKGDDNWEIEMDKKTGRHYKQMAMASAVGMDMEKASKEYLGKMHMEELGKETFLGYQCKKYRLNNEKNKISMDYLMYGNLMMKMDGKAMGIPTKMEVTKIEKVKPSADKFVVPKGIAISEN